MNKRGVTLIELLIVMVIGGMMILSVGVITDIGKESHQAMEEEARIYNGLTYGLKLLQNRVHEGILTAIDDPTLGAPWIGKRLEIGQHAFGVYDQTGNTKDFVYLPDKSTLANMQTIISVLDTDTLTNTYTLTDSDPTVPPVIDTVVATISGTADSTPFSMTTTAHQRR